MSIGASDIYDQQERRVRGETVTVLLNVLRQEYEMLRNTGHSVKASGVKRAAYLINEWVTKLEEGEV